MARGSSSSLYREAPSSVAAYSASRIGRVSTPGTLSRQVEPELQADDNAEPGAFSLADLKACTEGLDKDPQFRLAQTVLSRCSMGAVLDQRQIIADDVMVFSNQITTEGNPVANQKRSGRCWLFATTNVIRIFVSRKYNLDNFQLSQSYLYFVDHLCKANYFLEQMLDLEDEPFDSRTIQYLLANSETQDGGQYDMAAALIETYGLVPQTVYPESWNSSHSGELDTFLASKLREYAVELRTHLLDLRKTLKRKTAMRGARELKHEQMKEVYRILATCCGTPPQPNERFIWEFMDAKKQYHRLVTTPLDFAKSHTGYDASATMSLINDPRNPYDKLYTVQRLGNVIGGRPIRYLNLEIEELKDIAISLIKDNFPIWFGCDVEKASNTAEGVMDTKLYNYSDAFGTALTMTKRERLETGDSSMTHAMMFTGVHLDPETKRPVRWRVENSWGPEACNKGFLVMSDEWFTENVFQIVSPRSHVPPELVKLYDTGKVTELPPYDPMGALA